MIGNLPPAGRMGAPRELLRPFLFAAVAYLGVALLLGLSMAVLLLAGVSPPFGLRLAHVHLALLGGVSQAMLGAIPFFAMALLATMPPDPRLVRTQWWLANLGLLSVTAAFVFGWWPLGLAGGLLFLAATAVVVWIVIGMMGRSLIGRRLDVYYYFAATIFGLLGMLVGLLLVTGLAGDALPRSGLRLAHIHLTLVGWVSLTIVGTMYTFFPTIIGARAGSARLFSANFWLFVGGTAALSVGLLWLKPLATLGGLAIAVGAALLVADVLRARRSRPGRLGLAGSHLFAAAIYFAVTCAGGLLLVIWSSAGRSVDARWLVAYVHLALVGWVAQTLLGAMVHLLPVMAGSGGLMGKGQPRTSVAQASYGDWRTVMEGAAGWQFWLLNGGLVVFTVALILAPWLAYWQWPLLLGALAMVGAFVVFGQKVSALYAALRGWARR